MKKLLAVGVIVLFISVSIIPSTGTIRESHYLINDSTRNYNSEVESLENGVNITLNGTIGENGWYISCVNISFTVGPYVEKLWYQINDEGWKVYTGHFYLVICEDGVYHFCVKYEDNTGNVTIECIDFKIDQTKPSIDLTLKPYKENRIWYILFMATCNDETSGIDRVEFYMDNDLVCTDDKVPYEWTYTVPFTSNVMGLILNPQISEENVTFFALIVIITNKHNSSSVYSKHFNATAYDRAGNSETDEIEYPSYIPPGMYMFQHLIFPNNYTGHIGKFFIHATFD